MSIRAVPNPRLFTFVAGDDGEWSVQRLTTLSGDPLPNAARLAVAAGSPHGRAAHAAWTLRGVTSNERYVERAERAALLARQEGLGRAGSVSAALVAIRKTSAWWALTQEERREIFEAQSRHVTIGLRYLPAVARRLHHCRDLESSEGFDFVTWFEFAPADAVAFDDMLQALRATPEWAYVDREVDLRLALARPT